MQSRPATGSQDIHTVAVQCGNRAGALVEDDREAVAGNRDDLIVLSEANRFGAGRNGGRGSDR